ncbi:hypothetical protein M5K25_002999 [Dendrobium thyrsiflorum]|uniref:Uncharacterized protein n=1 Tax=Dendrobium thyrsiflorum TaxID=117978 RepID=A0ABD0VWH4_DENTH
MAVQRHRAASSPTSPFTTGQQASSADCPMTMWISPLSTSTHPSSFSTLMGHLDCGGGLGFGGGGQGVCCGGGGGKGFGGGGGGWIEGGGGGGGGLGRRNRGEGRIVLLRQAMALFVLSSPFFLKMKEQWLSLEIVSIYRRAQIGKT